MDFRNFDHPNTNAPCLHVKDEKGRTILELVKLTKSFSSPEPELGFEVWGYVEDDEPLGNVTYHATEEPEPWRFEPYVPRRRSAAEHPPSTWAATMPAALAEPWAAALADINLEEANRR